MTVDEPANTKVFTATVPVFNLVPAQGEPARFGFEVGGILPGVIDTAVRTGGDYGVDVTVKNTTETAGVLFSQISLWGVPSDPAHDESRGWECVAGGFFHKQVGKECPASHEDSAQTPFLTVPTSCARDPGGRTVRVYG